MYIYIYISCVLSNSGILIKCAFIPKLLNNPPVSFPLIKLKFLLSHTAYFDKSITFFICLCNSRAFGFWVFFSTIQITR